MPVEFDFSLDEDWSQNIERLKAHLETIDAECAGIFFDHLSILQGDGRNARRDFNREVLKALVTVAQMEAGEGGQ